MLQPSSIFSEILRSKIKILSMSWGPWFHAKESASGFLAVTHGTALKVVHLDVKLPPETGSQPQSQIKAISKDITPKFYEGLGGYHFTGPLAWMNTVCFRSATAGQALTCIGRLSYCLFGCGYPGRAHIDKGV